MRQCAYQNGTATATMALDAEGRLTALGDGAGHTSAFAYNADDQTTAITLPNGVSEQASYDANGRLVSWHDPGPGQNVTYAYAYDAASRVTAFTAVSGTDTLTCDAQSRLASDCGPQVIAHSPDHCYHWTYDGAGNLTTGTNIDGHINYGVYNGLNELVQGYTEVYSATATVYYGYDAGGDTTVLTSPVAATRGYVFADDNLTAPVAHIAICRGARQRVRASLGLAL